jgi:tyrosyl-DNA phosphodiesterase 2
VRQNFTLTDAHAPHSRHENINEKTLDSKGWRWRAVPYFTLMMIPKSLAVLDCFRMPLVSGMGKDALFVDILQSAGEQSQSHRAIRLCTTHLESYYGGECNRANQLATISGRLHELRAGEYNIIAGLVGGDMNAIDHQEHDLHKANNVNLRDVWEDEPAPQVPALKPFEAISPMTHVPESGQTNFTTPDKWRQ